MRRRFLAFWDIVFVGFLDAILLSIAIYIISVIKGDAPWYSVPFYYTIAAAGCIAASVTFLLILQRMTIDLSCNKVELFYLVNYAKNDFDLNSNWIIYPSEIEKIKVVKLTKEEKRKYTSAKFLFSKYLEIEMKFGHKKYVYISHYANFQIKKIIQLLTAKNK